jgi:hypothetical protein
MLLAGNVNAESLTGKVTVNLSHGPVAKFLPDDAFGGALDGQEEGEVARVYSGDNIARMRSAGLRKVSYRLRTELGIEAWHWSEQGTWSDPQHQQGYWVSSDSPNQRVLVSHGYRLPRRGNTIDQAANDGYSRLTDGDSSSFWKSNPYLDEHYTGTPNARYPQWVVIDFGKPRLVNALRINWGEPYAIRFDVQYGTGASRDSHMASTDPDFNATSVKGWRTFPQGRVSSGNGEAVLLRLVGSPVRARYVRILLYESSNKGPKSSTDIRDSLGFSIREIFLGVVDDTGTFQDEISHVADNKAQTVAYTSSTDPWHRAIDVDPNTEQPGFDLVFRSAITNGLPMLVPVPLLYDTPENAVAEIRFLKARHYAISQIEMGEEPDGQQVSPEHVAGLYLEFAAAIHRVDPTIALGGPSFQSDMVQTRFDGEQNGAWVTRFLNYLRARRRLEDYSFLSFEWYPFDNLCQQAGRQLLEQPKLLTNAFRRFKDEGVPTTIPWIISEYGFSAYAGRSMVEIQSALLNADIVGQFLTLGGKAAYLYGYEPSSPINEGRRCAGYGQMMLFESNARGLARWPMPSYFAARLLSHQWAQQVNRPHRLYSSSSDIRDGLGRPIVTTYAVQRPDGTWSIMLVNKDQKRRYAVRIKFLGRNSTRRFVGKVIVYQYSSEQYAWKAAGENGRPLRTERPWRFTLRGDRPVTLPAFSLTVVQGRVASPGSRTKKLPSLHVQATIENRWTPR